MSDKSTEIQNEPVLFTLENVFNKEAMNVYVGDLFFTSTNCYFIPYSYYTSKSGGAFLVGGLAAGIASSILEKEESKQVVAVANKVRNREYGLSLSGRLKRHHRTITISRNEITSLNMGDTLSIKKNKKTFEFIVPEISKHKNNIHNWEQNSIESFSNSCVLKSKNPPALALLESFVNGEKINLQKNSLKFADMDPDYFPRFWDCFLELRAKDKRAAVQSISNLNCSFSVKFLDFRQKEIRRGKNCLKIGLGLLLLSIPMIAYDAIFFINGTSSKPGNFFGLIMLLLTIFTLFFCIIFLFQWFKVSRL